MWWYAFVPAILSTLISVSYILYQYFAFKYSPLFEGKKHSFLYEITNNTYQFLKTNNEYMIPALLGLLALTLLYLFLPTLCQGALIQLLSHARQGKPMPAIEGVSMGIISFLPLFEYNLIIRTFSLFAIATEAAFVLRNLGPGALGTLLPFFLLAGIITFALTLLFTYSEFFIVLKRQNFVKSMVHSAKLVIVSWQHTFIIGILMILIGIRVIINILVVLIVPLLLFISLGVFAAFALAQNIALILGIILTIAALLVASYFSAIIHVFSNAVWTFTFLSLIESDRAKEFLTDSRG